MNYKHGMKNTGKTDRKWKIIFSVLAGVTVIALVFLAYLYFPIVSGSIDRWVKYLFSPPGEQESQAAVEEEEEEPGKESEEEKEVLETEPDQAEDSEENGSEKDSVQEEEESGEGADEGEDGEEQPEEEQEEDTIPQETAPTISLRILEGPLYSPEDDVCYYRIAADVTGDPYPSITFSKDDSLGSLGSGKAQVNITRDSQTFTLNATAKNSMGSASDSIILNWNCNRAPDITGIILETETLYINKEYDIQVEVIDLDGDELTYLWSADGGDFDGNDINPTDWDTPEEPGDYTISVSVTDASGNVSEASIEVSVGEEPEESENLDLPRKEGEGGFIEYSGSTNVGGNIYAGDSGDDLPCAGFVSFDITGIAGRTVDSATLTLTGVSISGDPMEFQDELPIHSLWWGAESINQGDFIKAGVVLASYDSPGITCSVSKLKEELQKAINDGKPRFQIRIQFAPAFTDNDGEEDGWTYSQSNVNLNVTVSDV